MDGHGPDQGGARVRLRGLRTGTLALLLGRPRRLTSAEVGAIKARPWPRLPAWLWAAAVLATAATVTVAVVLLLRPGPGQVTVPLGARRSPPGAGLSHDVGPWRAPALEAPTAARAEAARVRCPRLARVTVVGTSADVRVLLAAADDVCALRSVGGIDQARAALDREAVVVAFAGFTATGNESTLLLDPDQGPGAGRALDLHGSRKAVLVNGKFAGGAPQRVAALLVHEGAHLAGSGGADEASQELAARRAELAACDRLFPAGGDLRPNRGCQDAAELVAMGDARAIAALRAAGYR